MKVLFVNFVVLYANLYPLGTILDRFDVPRGSLVRMAGRFGQKMNSQSENGKERVVYVPEVDVKGV
jgi:hypothetical protein